MNLLQWSRGRHEERAISTLDGYAQALTSFMYGGNSYLAGGLQQSYGSAPAEKITNSLVAYASQAYAANGIVFACMAVRMAVFSGIRFSWQQMRRGRPGDLFGDQQLALLERPWPSGTTQNLLAKMLVYRDLAGNAYITRHEDELVVLRPDWVDIILEPRTFRGGVLGWRKIGYLYSEGGYGVGEPVPLLPEEVAHFAGEPDPLATYRGMSWLTPVLREICGDGAMTDHKLRFLENSATPNMVVKVDPAVKPDAFKLFKQEFDGKHRGTENAGRIMYLGGGADVTVVGADFKGLDLKSVQGAGETRIAAAAGVHPVIVGLSEGLAGSSLNAGNYGQARRRFADGTMHPLWQDAAGSLEALLKPPAGARLWYDTRDVPFLREDRKDAADIQAVKAASIRQLVDAGYRPDSVVAAVEAEDMSLLVHSGAFSVQLQPPATAADMAAANAGIQNGSGA